MNGKTGIFSIYDQKMDAYMRPFTAPTKNFAMRSFGDMLQEEGSVVSMHPEDYCLFQLGWMDEYSGVLTAEKISLGFAVEYNNLEVAK